MTRICFVSFEIHPVTVGGCGVLLHHSARLLLSQGHEVIFLFDMDRKFFQRFVEVERLKYPNYQNCRAYHVGTLVQGIGLPADTFKTHFEYKAYQFYLAASQLYKIEKPDLIEFFEYCGVGHQALNAKIAGLDFVDTHLAVRLHNSMELIDREQPDNIHGLDRYVMYGLERHALRCAETVLYPSKTYLEQEYLENYEPWFGDTKLSQPAMLDHPVAQGSSENPNGILFFGRLFGFKGVDRFVDAAALYLSDPGNPRRDFYLVGYASSLSPTRSGSYTDYLKRKIPTRFHEFFHFTGQITWEKFSKLLPEILFAVVPSYIESFCYAAYELYEAGIPLIVTDIPAFKDPFKHEVNALVSDGTVGDLAEKMALLSRDRSLREKIRHPYPLNIEPLGDFYSEAHAQSWISSQESNSTGRILICILVDDDGSAEKTLDSLHSSNEVTAQVVVMKPVPESSHHSENKPGAAIWFLGQLYLPQDEKGTPLDPTAIMTAEALLVLKAGDAVDQDYLPRSMAILQRQPQIGFVGSWKRRKTRRGWKLDTSPLDAVPEILPFIQKNPLNRIVMRTIPGKLLIDLFDPRAGRLGETGYLWELVTNSSAGVIIPRVLITLSDQPEKILDRKVLDYLQLRDRDANRASRLKGFHLTLADRQRVLRRFNFSEISSDPIMNSINLYLYRLATGRFSKSLDRYPTIKRVPTRIISFFYTTLLKTMAIFRKKT